jgi:Uma2 family endonuclease
LRVTLAPRSAAALGANLIRGAMIYPSERGPAGLDRGARWHDGQEIPRVEVATDMAIHRTSAVEGQSPPLPIGLSFEEFLAWLDEDARAEWVDGEIVLMSPARAEHQRLSGFLFRLLAFFVERHGLGEIFSAPFLMRLATRPSGREPDSIFVAAEHADRVRDTYLDGPADLVIEIVSPDSDRRDRVEKLREYEAAGVPEYWLFDPEKREALFYQPATAARFRLVAPNAEGVYRSVAVAGFWLRTDWLWQRPLPRVAEIEALLSR